MASYHLPQTASLSTAILHGDTAILPQSNLPTADVCFQNWLDAQSDDDLRRAMSEDVGDMIRDRVREEIERRGVGANITHLPLTSNRAAAT